MLTGDIGRNGITHAQALENVRARVKAVHLLMAKSTSLRSELRPASVTRSQSWKGHDRDLRTCRGPQRDTLMSGIERH
jgi:hypothetical protein